MQAQLYSFRGTVVVCRLLSLVLGCSAVRSASLEAGINGGVLQDPLNANVQFGYTDTLADLQLGHLGLFPDRPWAFGTVGRWENTARARPGSLGVGVFAAAQNQTVPSPLPVDVLVGTELLPPHNLPLNAGAYAKFSTSQMLVRSTGEFGLPAIGGFGLHFTLDGTATDYLLTPGALFAGGAVAEAGLFVELGMTYLNSSLLPVTQTAYGAVIFRNTAGIITYEYPAMPDLGLDGPNLLASYSGGEKDLLLAGTGLAVGQPFSVWVAVEANARASVSADAAANVGIGLDFLHTLSFPTSGSVADLPTGYTLDGPDVYVNDNSFQPIPEPSQWATLATVGCLGWAGWRRYHERRASRCALD